MMSPNTTITDVKRTSVAFPATMSFPRPVVTDTALGNDARVAQSEMKTVFFVVHSHDYTVRAFSQAQGIPSCISIVLPINMSI